LATSGAAPIAKLPLALKQALERGNCILFVGAGVGGHYKRSNGAPAPDGKQLCIDLVDHFKLNIDPNGRSLKDIAQLVELRDSRAALDTYLKKVFQDLQPDETIQWLTTFRWRAIFTTNYDMGLERAFALSTKLLQDPVPISATSNLEYIDTNVSVPIFHIHGTPYPTRFKSDGGANMKSLHSAARVKRPNLRPSLSGFLLFTLLMIPLAAHMRKARPSTPASHPFRHSSPAQSPRRAA
jgi:hypothetical protein